jgi:hypothetical protein
LGHLANRIARAGVDGVGPRWFGERNVRPVGGVRPGCGSRLALTTDQLTDRSRRAKPWHISATEMGAHRRRERAEREVLRCIEDDAGRVRVELNAPLHPRVPMRGGRWCNPLVHEHDRSVAETAGRSDLKQGRNRGCADPADGRNLPDALPQRIERGARRRRPRREPGWPVAFFVRHRKISPSDKLQAVRNTGGAQAAGVGVRRDFRDLYLRSAGQHCQCRHRRDPRPDPHQD